MTPEQIAKEYLRREEAANATQAGADPIQIIETMSEEYGIEREDVAQAVRDTIQGPC